MRAICLFVPGAMSASRRPEKQRHPMPSAPNIHGKLEKGFNSHSSWLTLANIVCWAKRFNTNLKSLNNTSQSAQTSALMCEKSRKKVVNTFNSE